MKGVAVSVLIVAAVGILIKRKQGEVSVARYASGYGRCSRRWKMSRRGCGCGTMIRGIVIEFGWMRWWIERIYKFDFGYHARYERRTVAWVS